jgi:Family of unknown function (DUF6236)
MESYMGLYYPFMEFTDDAWVKLAALYWEKLGRIVPKWFEPDHDSYTVRLLTDKLGFVKNLYPTVKDQEIVAQMFLEVLNKHEQSLIEHYGIKLGSPRHLKPRAPLFDTETQEIEKELYESHIQDYLQLLYKKRSFALNQKITRKLYKELREKELVDLVDKIVARISDNDSWLDRDRMVRYLIAKHSEIEYDGRSLYAPLTTDTGKEIIIHPKLAFIYVEALADQMASDRKLHLVTDDVLSHVATSGYTVERLAQVLLGADSVEPLFLAPHPQAGEVEQQIAAIALQSVIPQNLSEVPVKKIVKIRSRYRDEMIAFQNAIHTLAKDLEQLQEIDSLEAFKTHLEITYERELKPQFNDFRRCLKSLGIDTITSAMSIQVALPPVLASTLTGAGAYFHLASMNPLVLGAGALACSIFPVIRKKQEEGKQLVRSSPMSYLFYTREQLEPVNVAKWVTQHARKALFGI